MVPSCVGVIRVLRVLEVLGKEVAQLLLLPTPLLPPPSSLETGDVHHFLFICTALTLLTLLTLLPLLTILTLLTPNPTNPTNPTH